MAERVMMALGDFRFELDTLAYQKLAASQTWRWTEQARIGREPASQYLGPGSQELTLEGVIYPQFRGGLAQVEAIRDMAGQGEPLVLVDGLGRVWGEYVIVELGDTRTIFTDDGQPRRVEFSVKLRSYGPDGGAQ